MAGCVTCVSAMLQQGWGKERAKRIGEKKACQEADRTGPEVGVGQGKWKDGQTIWMEDGGKASKATFYAACFQENSSSTTEP